jgi:pteridine reductase
MPVASPAFARVNLIFSRLILPGNIICKRLTTAYIYNMDINGKKILITGGALRVGEALCRGLAAAGADIVIHCNRSRDAAASLAQELDATVMQCDFSNADNAIGIFDEIGPVDVLINNASVFEASSIQSETLAHCREQFEINFFAPLVLMREFYNSCLDGGCIINFLDQEVALSTGRGGGYSLSKKTLRDATLEAAKDFAPRVRVNGIAPGPVLPPPGMEASKMAKTLREVPLARPVALDDLVDAAQFLIRNESVTGTILYVDCGQHLN